MCKACATGNEKHPHNGDTKTCILGRAESIKHLPAKQQLNELSIFERLPSDMVKFIETLAKERKKTPLEVMLEENLL